VLGLDSSETRRKLPQYFRMLVDLGILEVVSEGDKAKRQATIYRYVTRRSWKREGY